MDDISKDLDAYMKENGLNAMDIIGLVGIGEIQLAGLCVKIAREKGTKSLLGSKRIHQLDSTEFEVGFQSFSPLVKNPQSRISSLQFNAKIELTWIEALSMAFIAYYHNQKLDNDNTTLIGVQVDENYQPQSELMLSDGVLLFFNKEVFVYSHIYQQVMAQNLYGKYRNSDLTDEVIRLINKKAARRSSYADGCGLIVSAVTSDSDLDIRRIIEESDADEFYPSFLIVYKNNFEDVVIYGINKKILEHEEGIELTTLSQKFKNLPE